MQGLANLHLGANQLRPHLADNDDQVGCCKVLLLVCDQDPGGPTQEPTYTVLKDVLANMSVHSRQGVIQQVDICGLVAGPCQGHSMPLPSTQIDSLQLMRPPMSQLPT